ncbi:MAG: hypothetical protein R2851_08790 [Caldilineaceae bacterium]
MVTSASKDIANGITASVPTRRLARLPRSNSCTIHSIAPDYIPDAVPCEYSGAHRLKCDTGGAAAGAAEIGVKNVRAVATTDVADVDTAHVKALDVVRAQTVSLVRYVAPDYVVNQAVQKDHL